MKKLINIIILSLTATYLIQAMFYGKKITYGLLLALSILLIYRFFKADVR